MAEKEKVTIMVLKVDLQCHKCYKKVKRVLCNFPQIRDQIYDEKQNQVDIKVVCCSPEKIRDRIRCKGGGAIKSIEIKEPEKPKPTPVDKHKDPQPKPEPAPVHVGYPLPYPVTVNVCCTACYHGHHGGPCKTGPAPVRVPCSRDPDPVTRNVCCTDCYHGHHGGPCETGYGGIAPYIQYDGYYGRAVYDSYGGGRSNNSNYCVARSDCFSEENPQRCTGM